MHFYIIRVSFSAKPFQETEKQTFGNALYGMHNKMFIGECVSRSFENMCDSSERFYVNFSVVLIQHTLRENYGMCKVNQNLKLKQTNKGW